jgi:hypothetical protein
MLLPAPQRGFCAAALLGFVNFLAIVSPPASGTNQSLAVRSASSSFMIVGIGAGEELYLVVENGLVDYEETELVFAPCWSALVAGWQCRALSHRNVYGWIRVRRAFAAAFAPRSAFLIILYTHTIHIVWFASSACRRMASYSM